LDFFALRFTVAAPDNLRLNPSHMILELEVPEDIAGFHLPNGVQARLHELLDKQDTGQALTSAEQKEAEGLVNLTEFLSLLHLRAGRAGRDAAA
jgi:hypothetical protein